MLPLGEETSESEEWQFGSDRNLRKELASIFSCTCEIRMASQGGQNLA